MNLLGLYQDACQSPRTLRDGRTWYKRARRQCEKLAHEHGTSLETSAGIVAALSPRVRWESNVDMARALLEGRPVHGLRRNVDKARRILHGEDPAQVLRGPKVCAFYAAILGDSRAVVVDTWMLRAVNFHTDKPTQRQYDRIALQIAMAATLVGTAPAEFQAIVWVQIRKSEVA